MQRQSQARRASTIEHTLEPMTILSAVIESTVSPILRTAIVETERRDAVASEVDALRRMSKRIRPIAKVARRVKVRCRCGLLDGCRPAIRYGGFSI